MGASLVRSPLAGLRVCTPLSDTVISRLLAYLCLSGHCAREMQQSKLSPAPFSRSPRPPLPSPVPAPLTPGSTRSRSRNASPELEISVSTAPDSLRVASQTPLELSQSAAPSTPQGGRIHLAAQLIGPPEFAAHVRVRGFHRRTFSPLKPTVESSTCPCSLPPLDFPSACRPGLLFVTACNLPQPKFTTPGPRAGLLHIQASGTLFFPRSLSHAPGFPRLSLRPRPAAKFLPLYPGAELFFSHSSHGRIQTLPAKARGQVCPSKPAVTCEERHAAGEPEAPQPLTLGLARAYTGNPSRTQLFRILTPSLQ